MGCVLREEGQDGRGRMGMDKVIAGGEGEGADGKELIEADEKVDGMGEILDGIDEIFEGTDEKFGGTDEKFGGTDEMFDGTDEIFDGIDEILDIIHSNVEGEGL
ncbi:hypothetical protein U1Q18_035779 [Sarracenia purpurea var. burkii]